VITVAHPHVLFALYILHDVLVLCCAPTGVRRELLAVREVPASLLFPKDNLEGSVANFSKEDVGLW